jgi:hypothetical protein
MTRRTVTVVVVGMLSAGAAAISMLSAFAQGAITADLILSNGKIVTVDDRFTIAQAVAIKGNRIVAIGANQEMDRLAAPNARRINLRGRAAQFVRNTAFGSIRDARKAGRPQAIAATTAMVAITAAMVV